MIRFTPHAVLSLVLIATAAAQRPPTLGSDPFRVVDTMPVKTPVADGVEIRVTDGNGNPVTSADVVVLENATMRTEEARAVVADPALSRFGSDIDVRMFAVATELGTRYATGESGSTRIAIDGPAMVFVAHRRTLQKVILTDRARADGIDVVLAPVPMIEIVVRNSRGRPAEGVPLVVVDTEQRFHWHSFEPPIETDREGRAFVPRPGPRESKDVLALVASRRPVRVRLEPDRAQVEMSLPPCGQLRVYAPDERLVDHRLTGGMLSLRDVDVHAPVFHRFEAEEIGTDFVTFRWVGVDEPVQVWLEIDGSSSSQAFETTGPELPDEMKVTRAEGLVTPLERSCRLIGLDGEPVASDTLLLAVTRPGRVAQRTVHTDAEGRVSLRIDGAELADDAILTLVRRRFDGEPLGAVRRDVAELRRADAEDLGDIALQQEPILIAGRVVDGNGEPVAGIGVSCESDYRIPAGGGGGSWSSTGNTSRFHTHSTTTDNRGRFLLRELNPERPAVTLQVELEPTARVDGLLEFPAGKTDVEIVVVPAAALQGSLVPFPEDAPFDGVVRLVAADGTEHDVTLDRSDATLSAGRLPPGTYTLEILAARREEPAFRLEGLELEAGTTCEDPRLRSIDWHTFLTPVRLRVVDPEGSPRAALITRIVRGDRGISSSRVHRPHEDEPAVIWVSDAGAEVWIQDPDYRTVSVGFDGQDQTVRLEPRPRLRMHVRNLPDLPTWMSLRWGLRSEDELPPGIRLGYSDRANVVTGEPQLVRPDLTGRARLRLQVSVTSDVMRTIRAAGGRIQAQIVRDLDVKGGPEEQELTVELTENEIADLERIAASIQELLDR